MPTAKILIVTRFDAKRKNGGDYQMMRSFAHELSYVFDVEICYGVPSDEQLNGVTAVLCTNLDRPIEALHTLHLCKAQNLIFMLYTLHHPHEGISAYLSSGVRGFKRIIARLAGNDPQRYEQGLWWLRTAEELLRHQRFLPQAWVSSAQRHLLSEADAVICCSAEESRALTCDIIRPPDHYIVPHPADAPAITGVDVVANRVIVAGRIEARKNQLMALEIAREMPDMEFVFVGGKMLAEAAYVAEFDELLGQVPNATHKTALPKEEFYSFLASAEIVLNPCFFEVTSLIDVYCLQNSIPLVTTNHTYLRGYGAFQQFDPTDKSAGIAALQTCSLKIRENGRKASLSPEPNATDIISVVMSVVA